jgi:hypothetical protein
MKNLSSLTDADLREIERDLETNPANARLVTLQDLSDIFADTDPDILSRCNEILRRWPEVTLRLYSSMSFNPVDLGKLKHLPDVSRIKIHYNVPPIEDLSVLETLKSVTEAEIEINDAFSFDFLSAWQRLSKLKIVREGKTSRKPDFSVISELPKLEDFTCIGYHNGIGAISKCRSLKRLILQDVTVKSWKFLPEKPLEFLRLNKVSGPEDFDAASLQTRVRVLELVRMEKITGFDSRKAIGPVRRAKDDTFSSVIDIEYLSELTDDRKNGHDWAEVIAKIVPPPHGIHVDPEADSLSVFGAQSDLVAYVAKLATALTVRYANA